MNRAILALAGFLLITFGAIAQTTSGLSKAEVQGRQLAQEILQQRPVTNFTQTAELTVRNPGGMTNIPVTFSTAILTNNFWMANYVASPTNHEKGYHILVFLMIVHGENLPNTYHLSNEETKPGEGHLGAMPGGVLNETQIWAPFAESDFWIADLGLEFFHWPNQKILRHEDKRTRACAVLESTNPNPSPGAYSRVVSWIDNETLGIVHAEAYDNDGKLLKVFDPKSFKKVNGQWELQDMEIRNPQTKSRSSIKFDLNSK
jgi:hypothetical protein